jgi:hypothetical protein
MRDTATDTFNYGPKLLYTFFYVFNCVVFEFEPQPEEDSNWVYILLLSIETETAVRVSVKALPEGDN